MSLFRIGSFGFRNLDLPFVFPFSSRGRLDATAESRAGNRLRIGLPAVERNQDSQSGIGSAQHVIEHDLFVRRTPAEHTVERSLRDYFSRQFAPQQSAPPPAVEDAASEETTDDPPPVNRRAAAASTTTFEVVTQDGDKVSISYNNAREVERTLRVTPNGIEYSASIQSQRQFSYSVEGDISDAELADIRKLSSNFDITGLGSLAAFRYSSSLTHEFSQGLSVAG
jgi:hypothetical protein